MVEPKNMTCPWCGGVVHVIGEDRSESLDVIPAQYQVIVTRRPKYACRACAAAVVQAAAPARLVEGGLPTEPVADIVVQKYVDHCPFYRPALNSGAAWDRDRRSHTGLLGGLCWGRAETPMGVPPGDVARLVPALCRRDQSSGARSRPRTHQDRLFLDAGPR